MTTGPGTGRNYATISEVRAYVVGRADHDADRALDIATTILAWLTQQSEEAAELYQAWVAHQTHSVVKA